MKRVRTFGIMMIVLSVLMMITVMAAPAHAQVYDNIFDSNKTLAPAKACTSGVRNYAGYGTVTMQLAAKGHNGDTVMVKLNQFASNFIGTYGYTIAGAGANTLVFCDTLYLTDTLWNYGDVKSVTLKTCNNSEFKAWNSATHDTINYFNIGVGKR